MRITDLSHWAVALPVVLTSVFTPANFALAQTDAADDAKRRINLAGRQRMFSQRMSKAACFVMTGVQPDKHEKMLATTRDQFETTLAALSKGNREMGLVSEINAGVVVALHRVDGGWADFKSRVQSVIDKHGLNAEEMSELNKSGLTLLTDMNVAVGFIARVYGDELPELSMILATTIDLAGRQRMFTQKAAKDFCLIDAGVDIDENREDLTRTLSYFNVTLNALIEGYVGVVMAAPNEDIRDKLFEVKTLWQRPNEIMTAMANGEAVSDEDRLIIANDVDKVLFAMNEAVKMYEFVGSGS